MIDPIASFKRLMESVRLLSGESSVSITSQLKKLPPVRAATMLSRYNLASLLDRRAWGVGNRCARKQSSV